jgi:hypothetical protein
MNIKKPQIGTILAFVCLFLLLGTFILPSWAIDRRERIQIIGSDIYVNSTHEFNLLGISTLHRDTHSGQTDEERLETSYFDVEDSDLGMHFLAISLMVLLATVFIVLSSALYRQSESKGIYKLIALGLGFAVIFLSLGSGAYLNIFVPSAVGDSRDSLSNTLQTHLPNIQSFAGTDLNETGSRSIETTWGPSVGWYLFFVVCILMVFSIWFTESRPKPEEEEEESED